MTGAGIEPRSLGEHSSHYANVEVVTSEGKYSKYRNILPTDPNRKIKLIIYYNKFKTSNFVIKNNSSPSIRVLQKKKKNNVIYQFKNSHSYKVVMYTQKLHLFCNTSSPDDGLKLGRKYLGNN